MMTELRCPFCGWHRFRDQAKASSETWDPDAATLDLLRHLDDIHFETFYQFLEMARSFQQSQMAIGAYPRLPQTVHCSNCNIEWTLANPPFRCPNCMLAVQPGTLPDAK